MVKCQYVITEDDMEKLQKYIEEIDTELGSLLNHNNLCNDDMNRLVLIIQYTNSIKNLITG